MPPNKPSGSPRRSITSLLFKQYPGQQQVDLAVKISIPGSWFSAGASGQLSVAERRHSYEAIATRYEERHVFEPAVGRKPAKIKEGLRFICPSDAADDPNHDGFWIELSAWNRYRHDTYKGNREAEVRDPAALTARARPALHGNSVLTTGFHPAAHARRCHTSPTRRSRPWRQRSRSCRRRRRPRLS